MMREYLLFDAFFYLRREVVFREKRKGGCAKVRFGAAPR